LTTFKITGDCDEVCAKLKTTLEANDAGFNANLNAMFNPPAPQQRTPAAPMRGAQNAGGWILARKR
jgi:hypothetical protein